LIFIVAVVGVATRLATTRAIGPGRAPRWCAPHDTALASFGRLERSSMATSETTIRFLLDQLSHLQGVRARKMFGEYALYCGEKVVALVCDDQVFVKITVPGKALVGERYAEGFAYPGARASMLVGADELDDQERLTTLFSVTAAALPSPKRKKPRTPQARQKTGKKNKARHPKTRS
jgi:DNA transformation protein